MEELVAKESELIDRKNLDWGSIEEALVLLNLKNDDNVS